MPVLLGVDLEGVELSGGGHLRGVSLRGAQYGLPLSAGAPIYVLAGGITASMFALGGPSGEPGWWMAMVSGEAPRLSLERHTILCPAMPGNGSTWRNLGVGPRISAVDIADLWAFWLDGVVDAGRPVRILGASLGGLVGLALAARRPERVAHLVTISAGSRPDGWGTGVRHLQRQLVRDALEAEGGGGGGDVVRAMVRARQVGMLSYRGREELNTRFARLQADQVVPEVAGYLEHHGDRFARSFSPDAFLLLSEAIDRFWLPPEVLSSVRARVDVVGVESDLLFPWSLQASLHRELVAAGVDASVGRLTSPYGHDAFLADQEKLAGVLEQAGVFSAGGVGEGRVGGGGSLRRIRIGMVGCGVVGQGLLELLHRQEGSLAERYGVQFEVTRLAVRDVERDRGPWAAGIPRTCDALSLVSDPDVDVIVEVAGGVASMRPVLRAALQAGRPVVTANKALLSADLAVLAGLARQLRTPLACEAAVAAALPVIRALSHRADEVRSLMGIVNGTCNYLLTRLEQDEQPLESSIAAAQALGLAEADPSADIDGHDAAAKLSILAYRCFGVWLQPAQLPTRGIRGLTPVDPDLAAAMGFRLRHLVRASVQPGGGLEAAVEPLLLPDWHLLASVEEEYNAVYLSLESAGDLSFFGKGAGGLPTATAVLGDLIDLAQGNSARWPAPTVPLSPTMAVAARRHFVRVSAERHPALPRRLEGVLRRAGLQVQSRATRAEGERLHLGFITSPSEDGVLTALIESFVAMGRVEGAIWLGVVDG